MGKNQCPLCGHSNHFPLPDPGLGPQQREFKDTFSAMTVIKEMFFPGLLTDAERAQIAKRDQ